MRMLAPAVETLRLQHEQNVMKEKIRDNGEKIKQNKVLPYLIGDSVVEPLANCGMDSMRKGKCAVMKTSTRQTVFLGLVPADQLRPSDLVGVINNSLPTEYVHVSRQWRLMNVQQKPTLILVGLEKQIEELVEAIILPMEQAAKFKTLGIRLPKGCLMYGPRPGIDAAKLVRDAFELAEEKAPAIIIFMDELDAIGTKVLGGREVQRTIDQRIKIDILDPALLRSGRLDRQIEFPLPNETARARIFEIHSRKMTVQTLTGATCVETGTITLREGATKLGQEHLPSGIAEGE
ncbi:P-loop containing nucleoside triphosphate hydrolase protein [Suillus placidus]|uniref:P-loop containing nucleoside triphosphate hydrolase protein n=1 Tax=Suillus placidus TaxID=48579 RepID=A0A9P6ZHM0_9AGAM|nr:P-loop containing nucleoside triphosphate hydrolase protein [Suillus placidus]